jgi:AraC-like DNA-binding protein
LAKIALALQRALERRRSHGEPGHAASHVVARGTGWTVADVVCTSGPRDMPFEERHTCYSIAVVLAGSFQYRSRMGSALMTPGSLMLGSAGQCYECGHEHSEGDRCVSFWYTPEYFERLMADAGCNRSRLEFNVPRVPSVPSLTPVVAAAALGVLESADVPWEELGIKLAATAVGVAGSVSPNRRTPANAEARVTRIIRMIDERPDADLTLGHLAGQAGLSPYHFLRTFERVVGITPHQYVLRARLREAAVRLTSEPGTILNIALDCGFGDISNFNRAFKAEFGVSPRVYLRR